MPLQNYVSLPLCCTSTSQFFCPAFGEGPLGRASVWHIEKSQIQPLMSPQKKQITGDVRNPGELLLFSVR